MESVKKPLPATEMIADCVTQEGPECAVQSESATCHESHVATLEVTMIGNIRPDENTLAPLSQGGGIMQDDA